MGDDARDDVIVDEGGTARCWWPGSHPDYVAYHDTEWGRTVHDDIRLFEKLCLEGFQSGLSWLTILRKRPRFREVFDGFDPAAVARYGDDDVARLLDDPGIIRHRGKVEATIANARATLAIQDTHGSLDTFVWAFAPDRPGPRPVRRGDIPATTAESTALSKALKRAGFRFVGPTTAYAFMQSMGMVNDHLAACDFG